MEQRYRLELIGITYNQIETGVYALILQQEGTTRRIPIIIGFPEAQAIECKLQEVATPRPLTHDTMVATLAAFGISLIEVEIYKLPNGVFAANLLLTDGVNERIVDARSSDAVALAIRTGAPIYTSEAVLRESAFDSSKRRDSTRAASPARSGIETAEESRKLDSLSVKALEEAMKRACENENYEEAARIKAELDTRRPGGSPASGNDIRK